METLVRSSLFLRSTLPQSQWPQVTPCWLGSVSGIMPSTWLLVEAGYRGVTTDFDSGCVHGSCPSLPGLHELLHCPRPLPSYPFTWGQVMVVPDLPPFPELLGSSHGFSIEESQAVSLQEVLNILKTVPFFISQVPMGFHCYKYGLWVSLSCNVS